MTEALEALAQALEPIFLRNAANKGIGYKHDVAGSPTSTGFLHGPGGYLTYPGVDPAVFHTVVMSRSMLGQLPAVPTVYDKPVYQTLVGVGSDSSTNESRDVCDDAIEGGILSGCKVWAPMGRVERSTSQLELNRLGMRNDRADPVDLQIVNSPMLQGSVFGQMNATSPADILTNDVSLRFWERNISFQRKLTKMLWSGNPANNAGNGYKEFTGFELLINTGYKDAETGARCYAMDSDVKNFGYKKINDNGAALVEALSYIHMTRMDLAERTGMMPVRWVLAMRPNLFWEIAAIWPCSYMTTGCNFGAGPLANANATLFMTADEQIRMRDDMRANRYLIINGDRIEVILDDGITEKNGDNSDGNFSRGCFSSDIYFIPMSVVGGRATTYFEYFDYTNPSLAAAAGNMGLYRVEGAFITTVRQRNWCIQWQSKIEPRLVFRTPWLAGRLQNVVYCPTQHTVEPFPENPYAFSQGATTRSGPSYYDFWS